MAAGGVCEAVAAECVATLLGGAEIRTMPPHFGQATSLPTHAGLAIFSRAWQVVQVTDRPLIGPAAMPRPLEG